MTDAPAPLTPLAEDWERMLCVVAHPDDMEFGAAAAVARWTGQGKTVVYCMVTSGEAGIDGMDPEQCRQVREAEQVESARIVGVDAVDFLHLPDGILEYGVPLRRAIAASVRRHRPEIVVTNNFRDTWGGRNLNQADHEFLTAGNVFTPDLIETWVHYKRSQEIAPVQQRPHPHEFELYYDI